MTGRDRGVDDAHQIVVIVAGISFLDAVREGFAIGSRSPRVGINDDIAVRRVKLVVGRELRPVSGIGAAVNFQDQRIFLRRIVIGRSDHPRIDRLLVEGRGDGQLLDIAEHLGFQQARTEPSQALGAIARRNRDLVGVKRIARGQSDDSVPRHAEIAAGVGPVELAAAHPAGDLADRAVEPDAADLHYSAVLDLHVDRIVAAPRRASDRSVERAGEQALARAVGIHHVQLRVLIAEMLVVESDVGDVPPVRRHDRPCVRAVAVGERDRGAAVDADPVNLAVDRLTLPVFRQVGAE